MPVMGGTEAAAHIVARYPQPGGNLQVGCVHAAVAALPPALLLCVFVPSATGKLMHPSSCASCCDTSFASLRNPRMCLPPSPVPSAPGRRLPYLVALTADTTDGVDARCTLAGFHRVLTKPADMDAVRAALEAMASYHCDEGQRPSLVVPVTLLAP
jgi:CheY-like chemotaxis protein